MQPAQRPTIAEHGAFLNHGMYGVHPALAGVWILHSSSYIAAQQTGPFASVRQEIRPCRLWSFQICSAQCSADSRVVPIYPRRSCQRNIASGHDKETARATARAVSCRIRFYWLLTGMDCVGASSSWWCGRAATWPGSCEAYWWVPSRSSRIASWAAGGSVCRISRTRA